MLALIKSASGFSHVYVCICDCDSFQYHPCTLVLIVDIYTVIKLYTVNMLGCCLPHERANKQQIKNSNNLMAYIINQDIDWIYVTEHRALLGHS